MNSSFVYFRVASFRVFLRRACPRSTAGLQRAQVRAAAAALRVLPCCPGGGTLPATWRGIHGLFSALVCRYTADEEHGTVMEVTYEGEAHHPGLQPPPPARPRPQLSPGRTAQRMEFVESRRRSRGEEEEDPLLGILAEISELTSLRFPRSHQSEEEESELDTSLLTAAAPGVAEVSRCLCPPQLHLPSLVRTQAPAGADHPLD